MLVLCFIQRLKIVLWEVLVCHLMLNLPGEVFITKLFFFVFLDSCVFLGGYIYYRNPLVKRWHKEMS